MAQSEQERGASSEEAPATREVKRGDLAPLQGIAVAAAASIILWSLVGILLWLLW